MKKLIFIVSLGLALFSAKPVLGQSSITLAWDASCNTNVVGYSLYYTTNTLTVPVTNVYPAYIDDCGVSMPGYTNVYKANWNLSAVKNVVGIANVTNTVTNLSRGKTYYFVVTAKSATMESDKSSEIWHTIPLFPTNVAPSKVTGVRILSITN